MSIDGIKLKSIQVAASYTERNDPCKTSTILVAYGTEGQQSTRLNLKMNFTNEKKNNSRFIMPNQHQWLIFLFQPNVHKKWGYFDGVRE